MPTDEEIQTLWLRVLQAKSNGDFENAISNLRAALTERILEIENLGIHMILNKPKELSLAVDAGDDKDEPNAA